MDDIGGCYIPAHIMAREDLSLVEKVVYGRIVALTGAGGYCWASNEWLGKQLDRESKSVSRIVSNLVEKGLLVREVERDEKGQIIKRKLYPFVGCGDTYAQNCGEVSAKLGGGMRNFAEDSIETSIEIRSPSYISADEKKPRPTKGKSSDPFPDLSIRPETNDEILHAITLFNLRDINSELFDRFIERARLIDKSLSLAGKVKMSPSAYNPRVPIAIDSDTSSTSSLSVCTDKQLWMIARDLGISIDDVVVKYDVLLELFESGDFKKRYKHKTAYYTLRNWLRMDRDSGRIDTIDGDALAELREDSPTRRRTDLIVEMKMRRGNGLHS